MKNDKRKFILDTLLPYKEDPTTCAKEDEMCVYLTDDGKKCAVGKHMKDGPWQKLENVFEDVLENYDIGDVLTDEALEQGLSIEGWSAMQAYHDGIATGARYINKRAESLEIITGIRFPELYVNN